MSTSSFKSKTIFCDIDGTIFKYRTFASYITTQPELLPGAKQMINKWYNTGHVIILTTARPEYLRYHTMKELSEAGIQYHQLVTSCGRGTRFLINDKHPEDTDRAISFNLKTDEGFENVDWRCIDE